jgi:ubiquitin C-terminal hydrolase
VNVEDVEQESNCNVLVHVFMSGENQYKIPKNAVVVGSTDIFQDAEKRLKITKLPDMLCLTLKRFSFDPRTSSMRKVRININHNISFHVRSQFCKMCNIDGERLYCED